MTLKASIAASFIPRGLWIDTGTDDIALAKRRATRALRNPEQPGLRMVVFDDTDGGKPVVFASRPMTAPRWSKTLTDAN